MLAGIRNWRLLKATGRRLPLGLRLRLLGKQRPPTTADLVRNGVVRVGRHTYPPIPPIVHHVGDAGRVTIGAFTSIANGCAIFTGGEHIPEWVTTYPLRIFMDLPGKYEDSLPWSKGDVSIGNDVWLGFRSVVLSGVTIGDGAIVAAGAIVTSDVPPYAVVAGIPAKVIRYRFSSYQIERLREVAWWNWDDATIRERCADLSSPDIDSFLAKYAAIDNAAS